MTKKLATVEDKINDFTNTWGVDEMMSFLEDYSEIYDIYNSVKTEEELNNHDKIIVRLSRTAYLISKFAEKYSTKLVQVKAKYPGLYKQMEQIADDQM